MGHVTRMNAQVDDANARADAMSKDASESEQDLSSQLHAAQDERSRVRIHIHIHTCVYMCIYIYTYVYIYTYMYTYVYIYMHACIYINTRVYICIHIYTRSNSLIEYFHSLYRVATTHRILYLYRSFSTKVTYI